MQAHTIEQVIALLRAIIETEIAENSKLAFFPILYKKVTEAVKEVMDKKEFENNERMEKLDVVLPIATYRLIHNSRQMKSALIAGK